MSATRFAPNVSGPLHVGNAFVALLTSRLAQILGLEHILRLDDVSVERWSHNVEQLILDDLDWLGLSYDRIARESQYVLPDLPTMVADKGQVVYAPPSNLSLEGSNHSCDALLGMLSFPRYLFRYCTAEHYSLAACDAKDGVALVVRDATFLPKLPAFAAMFLHLNASEPIWAHVPVMTDGNGNKLSKTAGNTITVNQLRSQGLEPPEAKSRLLSLYSSATGMGFDDLCLTISHAYERFGGCYSG